MQSPAGPKDKQGTMDKWQSGNWQASFDVEVSGSHHICDGLTVEGLRLDEFLINAHRGEEQRNAQATILCDRCHVVVWQGFDRDGDQDSIHGQRYDQTGQPLGEEFKIGDESLSGQHCPSITPLCNGGCVVIWLSFSNSATEINVGIYGQLMDTNCKPIGPVFTVTVDNLGSHERPSVSTLHDGGFLVTWGGRDQAGKHSGHQARRYDAMATPLTDPVEARVDQSGAVWLKDARGLARIIKNNAELTGYTLSAMLPGSHSDTHDLITADETKLTVCLNHQRLESHSHPCELHTRSNRK